MAKSSEELAHQEWLGYVQPVGLVVSIPALVEAQCYVNKNIAAEHARFLGCLARDESGQPLPQLRDFAEFTTQVLGWEADDIRQVPPHVALTGDMAPLEVVLPQYHDTLRPTRAVPVFPPAEGQNPWLMLVGELPPEASFDGPAAADSARHWSAPPQARFERLLRETGVPIGLLFNHRQLRLVYAPKGESSGHATFNVAEMMQVAGRPMFAALHTLLGAERLFSLAENQRLPAILQNSRKYQNTVSTKLAEQVLAALYELMRGFQAADDVRHGDLLRHALADDPNHVYAGLLTVLMRLVFVLYAEDRDLLSSDPIYANHYSVTGLFNRLREDAGRHPDTMNQRYGAWSQLITLFRLIYEGGQHGAFRLPARKGYLFDPERYPFLEGGGGQESDGISPRSLATRSGAPAPIPRISDGVLYKVLRNLLILDGERLSYRTLDVEQIGSVYETVMGFNLEVSAGKSIAIKPVKTHGAPATINLEALLAAPGKDRAKWLKEHTDQTLGKEAAAQLKAAATIEELLSALDKKIQKRVTPRMVPGGAIILQPSDERRRSGSHYTPRSLTEPIVRTTLQPILKQLCDPQAPLPGELQSSRHSPCAVTKLRENSVNSDAATAHGSVPATTLQFSQAPLPQVFQPSREDKRRYTAGELDQRIRQSERAIERARRARAVGTPHPEQILDLKICDPAMGSGAFLVETCRQLAEALVQAWYAHDALPADIPPDEDEVLYARRLVAQRCLYGVDKNIVAVDLAKLSLWLVTLAKEHPFTFLDHALRHGDSLVGLSRKQIIGFHWEPKKQKQFGEERIQKRLDRATEARAKILNAREDVAYRDQEQRLAVAEEALAVVRLTADACASAFFAGTKKKQREDRCEALFGSASDWYASGFDPNKRGPVATAAASLRTGEHPISPFHWEIEFPEVFSRENGGFDAFVGNPPFAGKNTLIGGNRAGFPDWLKQEHAESHGNADLVAHFFRRAFNLLRPGGTFGLIATNTIAQGDTRGTGLRWICTHGGTIYAARRRYKWPGQAAVVVSVVHVCKGAIAGPYPLDGREVDRITAYLFHAGGHEDPARLAANAGKSFIGSYVLGMGFTFDDTDKSGVANPLSLMHELIAKDPRNAERIFPYIGGEEVNDSPTHAHHRYVINFGEMTEDEARKWPDIFAILDEKCKGTRARHSTADWWHYERTRRQLYERVDGLKQILCTAQTGNSQGFAFTVPPIVWSHTMVVFPTDSIGAFAAFQFRGHQEWARWFGATMKDDLRYIPGDCFETFPFPESFETDAALEEVGREYYEFRAALMVRNNEGLTKTYNRFHDPHERSPDILQLRELHAAMDRAVLTAYGWTDLADSAHCEFLLDYEEALTPDPSPIRGEGSKSKKKKPWRYRWPDDFRDEVLARLLALNAQRHQQEQLLAQSTAKPARKPKSTSTRKPRQPKAQPTPDQRPLFPPGPE